MTRTINCENLGIGLNFQSAEVSLALQRKLFGGVVVHGEYVDVMMAMAAIMKQTVRLTELGCVVRMTDVQEIQTWWRKDFRDGPGSDAEEKLRVVALRPHFLGVYFLSTPVMGNLLSSVNSNFFMWLKSTLTNKIHGGGLIIGCSERVFESKAKTIDLLCHTTLKKLTASDSSEYLEISAKEALK